MPSRKKERRVSSSFSEALSVSLGLQEQGNLRSTERANVKRNAIFDEFPLESTNSLTLPDSMSMKNNTVNINDKLVPDNSKNRTFYNDSIYPPENKTSMKSITVADILHRQTAELSKTFYDSNFTDKDVKDYIDIIDNDVATSNESDSNSTPEPYLGDEYDQHRLAIRTQKSPNIADDEQSRLLTPSSSIIGAELDLEAHYDEFEPVRMDASSINRQNESKLIDFSQILHYFPAAVLGLLLNILDALSYGMIIFPITEPIFANMGTAGISMFYISSIICQYILSGGFSSFPTGIGSEMIEITPFYHTMALAIKNSLDVQEEIISTTIFCYVISSLVTGLVFYSLGKLKLGKIVAFFPRHILIGCIGGVGYFLVVTGLEVTTRVAKVEYSWEFLSYLLSDFNIIGKWLTPILLTTILIFTQHHFQNSLVLPSFYIITIILFHFIVALVPMLSLNKLRDSGWIFPLTNSNDKWFDHYKYFNVYNVSWVLILKQMPTMLALTFFGILHVPINVPALAMSLNIDKFDVDREFIAHGYSNFLSGLFGSVQNYLVYTNSVLFIRAGADSPIAGYLLIVLTAIVMLIGPVIISFIPICIVGSLIFLLGYELLIEALLDTVGKVTFFEYTTIIIIVFTMGIYDFVLGIIVGILLACIKFMVDGTKLQTINTEYDGTIAKSTVYRDFIQSKFLDGIGEQIYLIKLQNVLFFGTIISIEEKIDTLLQLSDSDSSKHRIRYLILDFKNINDDNIDYSAAEGFNRIKRFTHGRHIKLIISSITHTDKIYKAFNKIGLLQDIELFSDLNNGLEWCENKYLEKYRELHEKAKKRLHSRMSILQDKNISSRQINSTSSDGNEYQSSQRLMSLPLNTPRNHQLLSVARNVFKNETQAVSRFKNLDNGEDAFTQLLLQSIRRFRPDVFSESKDIRAQEIKFWTQLAPYFNKIFVETNSTFLNENNFFFLLDSGVIKVTHDLAPGKLSETMLSRTSYGILSSKNNRTYKTHKVTFIPETKSVIWLIDSEGLKKMEKENLKLYSELTLLIMSISDYRFKALLGYTLVNA
ncbi:hypothetical protein TPHA_0D04210 [Tetrapisispora phaffii CBS 4417]|uniref:STAS domain-containing protein n=1 Tax=Tetrapisispora phaffii (strain ATCC 24235 / CBS 4417 / NBRC 1672 / NRRL Y-8282 / UCD 70-5) TaxID=1071381 RepID=G8BRY0_TETPH|nr:hypothetical protein TPHA_0D04210 [Tetrapisispora phaffii CBS 4417]CCE63055.1 hypothetical protein TPHA_0D04210 [Tetrapisispora phaffii CBS 4417]